MAQQIQWRRGTAAAWTAADPILADGEAGYETDTAMFKLGDGTTVWSALPYSATSGAASGITFSNTASGLEADNVQEAIDELVAVPKFSAGCVTEPTYTKTSDSLITVDAVTVYLYKTTDFSGGIYQYTLASKALAMTDNVTNYIVAKYNAGTPTLAVTTSVSDINESDVIPVFTIPRTGSYWHVVPWDTLGLGAVSKLHYAEVKTDRYRREYGLAFAVNSSLQVSVDAGRVWIAANAVTVDAASSATDTMFFCYHSSSAWTYSIVTTLNNTQYDNGTGLATLTANRYAVNWIYRGVETQKHIYVTLGTGDYTLTEAQEAQPPSPPDLISSHAVLIGKVIYQKSSSTYYSLQSAFDTAFVTAGVTDHGDLTGLTETAVHPAASISVDASGFTGNLSASDTDVQTALETIDAMTSGSFSLWADVASVTRTDSNTFAKAGLESVLPVGTHVRSYSGTTRPVTTSTDWKHHYVISVGTDAVDVIGEEIPTGGTTLFVEYSTDIASTMKLELRTLGGAWAAETSTGLVNNPAFNGHTIVWSEPTARLIGAMQIKSVTDDTGAAQPTIMPTAGGTDLLGGAVTVVDSSYANTGVIASGQAVSNGEVIDVDCESTGTNAVSFGMRIQFLIARHI